MLWLPERLCPEACWRGASCRLFQAFGSVSSALCSPLAAAFSSCVPVVRQLLDVVHQAVELPLPVDLLPTSQGEAVEPLVGRSRYAEESQAAVSRFMLHLHFLNPEGVILHPFARRRQHDRHTERAL